MKLLAIEWGVVGIKAAQLILCLSILVILHEMGHFLPAKWFKCRVEKFYLFFDPWFSLFKKKKGDTEYGIGWLPLGGYVKISGMIDESMDKEQMKQPPQPYEFRSKKAWQRLIIMIGGVTVNLILGFFIFAMVLWIWDETYLPTKNTKYGIYLDSIGKKIGLQENDFITGVNGKPVEKFEQITLELVTNEAKTIQVLRNGEPLSLNIPEGTIKSLTKSRGALIAYPKYPAVVDSVDKTKVKFIEGELLKNDKIIGLNNEFISSYPEFVDKKRALKNKEISITVLRNEKDTAVVKALTDANASVGFFAKNSDKLLDYYTKHYSFFESFPAGISKGWNTLISNLKSFKLLFTSKEVSANDSLGSFLSIGGLFSAQWDWERFWNLTALLSIVLAFMNLLPIPGLDGGHVVFTIYEMITGHKPSDKFMEYAQYVGMVLLLGLMAYAIGLDFFRFLRG